MYTPPAPDLAVVRPPAVEPRATKPLAEPQAARPATEMKPIIPPAEPSDTSDTAEPLAVPAAHTIAPDSPERFINRELSWLDFNHRVMEEAENPRHPLLERVRFVSISASNLDEFYSVRIAGLVGQAKAGVTAPAPDGRSPAQQLVEIKRRTDRLLAEQQRVWRELRTALRGADLEVCEPKQLSPDDVAWLDAWF